MPSLLEVGKKISDLYDLIFEFALSLQPDTVEEIAWREYAATVPLSFEARVMIKWYLVQEDADASAQRKATRLLFDTMPRDDIDVIVTDEGKAHFFLDMRGSVWLSAIQSADGDAFHPFASAGHYEPDLNPLINLLLSEPIPPQEVPYLTDLLARHRAIAFPLPQAWSMAAQRRLADELMRAGLHRKRGRQTIPLYDPL
jgi:hypothetical protein